jgi:hypothetical protein
MHGVLRAEEGWAEEGWGETCDRSNKTDPLFVHLAREAINIPGDLAPLQLLVPGKSSPTAARMRDGCEQTGKRP